MLIVQLEHKVRNPPMLGQLVRRERGRGRRVRGHLRRGPAAREMRGVQRPREPGRMHGARKLRSRLGRPGRGRGERLRVRRGRGQVVHGAAVDRRHGWRYYRGRRPHRPLVLPASTGP